jgi:hypothetical protein
MRADLVKIVLIILLVISLVLLFKPTEGFDDTIMDKVQDRANPLASQQHPLTNPAANIGISQSSGSSLRTMSQTALNIPMQVPSLYGLFTTKPSVNTLSPRIDNESSFLGLVKFCKDTGAALENPFTDANFAANCGMCMSSGTLITGESFTVPTGVAVYQKDKDMAYDTQKKNKYRFPRALPSLKGAICQGTSLSDDSIVPVLAIDERMFKVITYRNACKKAQNFGNSCGQCTSDTNSWSYVQNPPDGGIYETSLYLYGKGIVQASVGGVAIGKPQTLSMTATVIDLGVVIEGSTIQLKVTSDADGNSPFLYSALSNTLPNGNNFLMPFDDLINKDEVTGSYPRRMSPKFFTDVSLALSQILPSAGQTAGSVKMILDATMPLTFVNEDQIAAYDCETGPYTMTQEHAQAYISGNDPCLNPPGQGPNNYSEECIQSKLFAAGCSTAGDWYLNGLPGTATVGANIGQINTWLQNKVVNPNDPEVAKGCYGQDLSTPCDEFIGTTQIPNNKCLAYLYANTSAQNARLGTGYPSGGPKFLSLNKNTPQFCQPEGTLNPGNAPGLAELKNVASGYGSYKGVDAVKAYLSDVFTKAIGNLDINLEDSAGGRKTSWMKCFGIPIDDLPVNTVYVQTTPSGGVTPPPPFVPPVPPPPPPPPPTVSPPLPPGPVHYDPPPPIINIRPPVQPPNDGGSRPPVVPPVSEVTFLSRLTQAQFNKVYDQINVNCENSGVCNFCNKMFKDGNGSYSSPNLTSALKTNDYNVYFNNILKITNANCPRLGNTTAASSQAYLKSILDPSIAPVATPLVTNACAPATGSPVYASVEVGTVAKSPWYGWGGWENNAPPVGSGVMWIWNTPNANVKTVAGPYVAFSYVFCNSQAYTNVYIAAGIDNTGTISVNGNIIFNGSGGMGVKSVALVPGSNKIIIEASNREGPAGVWLAMMKPEIKTLPNPFDSSNPNNILSRYTFSGGANSAYVKNLSTQWLAQNGPKPAPGPVICKTDTSWVWAASSKPNPLTQLNNLTNKNCSIV